MTDGKDNRSAEELKRVVRQSYPNGMIHLFVIRVGHESDVGEFSGVADMVILIEDFDSLGLVLLLVTQMLPGGDVTQRPVKGQTL